MAKLLLNLRNVPDDEADDVRTLLQERNIAFYETRPSLWGISGGGIWVKHDEDTIEAMRLMADYQHRRQARAREEYEAAKRAGKAASVWTVMRDEPARALAVLAGIVFLLAVTALPFLFLLRN